MWVPNGLAVSRGHYDKPLYPGTAPVVPSARMNKSGTQSLTGQWAKLAGWTADGAYASTVVEDNSLKVTQTGTIIIRGRVEFTTGTATSARIRVLKNDTILGMYSATWGFFFSNSYSAFTRVIDVAVGDKISVEVIGIQNTPGWWIGVPPSSSYPIVAATSHLMFENYVDADIDFEKDMVYSSEAGFFDDTWGRYVTPTYLKKGLPFLTETAVTISNSGNGTAWLTRGSVSGPVLAQTRKPIPVETGTKVNMSGTFRVRKTGSKDEQTQSGTKTGIDVRFSLWGVGIKTDEYGVETLQPEELMFYQTNLQAANSQDESIVEFTIPTIPDATVPAGVDGVYFTCSLVHAITQQYGAGTFASKKRDTDVPATTAEMKYFGWSHANPLKITITDPPGTILTTRHPMSKTGVAFKNRNLFTNIKGQFEIVFFGTPGSACTINVSNASGGAATTAIGSYTAAIGERKVITATATSDQIYISGTGDFFIESVTNAPEETLGFSRNRIEKVTWTNIIDDVTKIDIRREEGDTGNVTIDFSSSVLDPVTTGVLNVGKRIRVLGRHYGPGNTSRPAGWTGEALHSAVFTGIIRKINVKYDYRDEPIIQIIAYDAVDRFEKVQSKVAFDRMDKYGPIFNAVGVEVVNEGFNWGGRARALPNAYLYNPAAHEEKLSLHDGVIMTRNTNKLYVCASKDNVYTIIRDIPTTPVFTLTDGSGAGDMSYGDMEYKSDTEEVINQVVASEKLLDEKEYKDRTLGSEAPPNDLRYPGSKSRSATFTNIDSVQAIGTISKSFDVVRGSGDMNDLYDGKFGDGFTEWAADILATHQNADVNVGALNVPMKNSETIYLLSQADLFSPVDVVHEGVTDRVKIRSMEHTITPGKWFCKLGFASKADSTYW